MSKNFELMQDAQIRLDIPEIGQAEASPPAVNGAESGSGKEFGPIWKMRSLEKSPPSWYRTFFSCGRRGLLELLLLRESTLVAVAVGFAPTCRIAC